MLPSWSTTTSYGRKSIDSVAGPPSAAEGHPPAQPADAGAGERAHHPLRIDAADAASGAFGHVERTVLRQGDAAEHPVQLGPRRRAAVAGVTAHPGAGVGRP